MKKWQKILLIIICFIILIISFSIIYQSIAFINKKEVKQQLANHLNISYNDIYFENIELELDKKQYEIDFYYDNNEYEAKMDAKDGKLIYTNFIKKEAITDNNNNQISENEISLEQAKEISLKYANLQKENVTLVKAKQELDNNLTIYEIEWKDENYEYDFDISKTGKIIHYDKDSLYD